MMKYPHRADKKKQVKTGKTTSGSQMDKCKIYNRKYTITRKHHVTTKAKREQAIHLVFDGIGQRQAARHIGVSHRTVANWLGEYADNLLVNLPAPEDKVDAIEKDELFTYLLVIKKTKPMK